MRGAPLRVWSRARRAARRHIEAAALAAALGLTLAAGPAPAQPELGVPDVPAGTGTIAGRVTGDAGSGGMAGLAVVLYAIPAEGEPGLRHGVTDAEGRFRFEGVSTDPGTTYLLATRSADVPFGTRVAFPPGETQVEVEFAVTQPIAATGQARLERSVLRVESGCEGVRIAETHSLENPSGRVIFVPEDERADAKPILRAVLPAQAGEIETSFGTPPAGIVRSGRELAFWGPVYPGSQTLEFGYALEPPSAATAGTTAAEGTAESTEIERGFPDGAPRVVVLSEPDGARLESRALREVGRRNVDGRSLDAAEASQVAPGAALAFRLDRGPAAEARLRVTEVDAWLELDDAALQVDEAHRIAVESNAPIEAVAGAPLVCLRLPPGAQDLRFAPDALAMGLEPDPSGALAVRGPIPAGESTLALRYRLPAPGGEVRLSRRFSLPVELLSVFVADTGVRVETDRLHRRRSVRTDDRSWMQLEGFQIAAGESVDLAFAQQPAPRPLPRLAHAGFALVAAGAAFVFLIGPLRRGAAAERGESAAERLAAERAGVLSAIRDLDEDFETGKLTAEDHAGLREELRARAVRLLAEERKPAQPARSEASPEGAQRGEAERSGRPQGVPSEGGPPQARPAQPARAAGAEPQPSQAAKSWRFCPDCGSELPGGARFCPSCGVRLADRSGPG